MNEEQIAKAREAKSAEELLALAKEYGIEDFTEKDAEDLYEQLHSSSELTDEELENVAGGCTVKINGTKYTVVTMDTKCKIGQWEDGKKDNGVLKRFDCESLRNSWYGTAKAVGKTNRCGSCYHLGFKSGSGYCELS